MPKDKNQLESVPENHFTSTLFTHEGITYDSKKNEITFSDEARGELQKLIDTIQAGFPIEEKNHETIDESVSVKNITEATITNVTDAMIVAGKGKKSVEKFMERVKILLQGKKKGGKFKETERKVEKKVEKYKNSFFAHITLQYTEDGETKSLREAPIIVRPGEKITVMLGSLQTRLRFAQIKK